MVHGLGFGFRIQGLEPKVKGLGLALRFKVLGFRVEGEG
jgi:hypothetical protein